MRRLTPPAFIFTEKCRAALPPGTSDREVERLRDSVLLFAEFIIGEALRQRPRVIRRRRVRAGCDEEVDPIVEPSDDQQNGTRPPAPVIASRWVRADWLAIEDS